MLTLNDLFSRKEAAAVLGMPAPTLYHLTKTGQVEPMPFGERVSGAPVATVYTRRMVEAIRAKQFPVAWTQAERDQVLTVREMAAVLWPEDSEKTRVARLQRLMRQDPSHHKLVGRVALYVRVGVTAVCEKWQDIPDSPLRQKGEAHPATVLTDEQIEEMRKLRREDKWTYRALGERYGVSESGAFRALRERR